uniref:FliM/FliN family flagellar motor switch protein n=1 Tax=Candidatus Stercorousia sp. TaxID=3048886 RepID=UPI004027DCBA
MGNEKINSIDYKELYAQYNWFSNAYPPIVQASSDEFFLPGLKFILIGISKNINTLMDKDAYFVTKIRIDKLHDMFFRTSEKAIGIILDRALGKPNSRFNLNKLTDLEAKIITAFNDYMFNATSQFLTQAPPSLKRTNFDVVHLTFLVKDVDTNAVAKFIITLPDELLAPEVVTSQNDKFDYGDFSSSVIDVAVKVGSTKFKLIDIKDIDVDDIVVFDNSDTKHMVLKFKDYETDININPNLGLVMPVDNDGGNEEMAGENTNLWDSIEVEMDAQFDTVKITLGELKSIEKGLVVDLTSIYDNKVTLSVENKPIARGELVIVNDRYGVKIDEVIAKTPKVENNQAAQMQNEEIGDTQTSDFDDSNMEFQEETPAAPAQNTDEEDEFDYSDFELEDEDI